MKCKTHIGIDEHTNYYIRVGEIPVSGKSSIFRGDEIVGQENGVSVYDCALKRGNWVICVPFPCREGTIDTIHGILLAAILKYKNSSVYLVTGTEIGEFGADGEPLLKDVRIIANISDQYSHYLKENDLFIAIKEDAIATTKDDE